MKVKYKDITADIIVGTEFVSVLSCSLPDKENEIEEELNELAQYSAISNEEARAILKIPENVGARNVPAGIKAVLCSFNGEVYPLKNEVISFVAMDDRYPSPILWKKRRKNMMLVKNLKDVEEFNEIIAACKGQVWIESVYGDKYNLKSELSRYVAIADMLRDEEGKLEIFASLPEDEALIMEYIAMHR